MIAMAVAVPGLVHEQLDKIPLWRSLLLIAASPEQPIVSVGWTLVHEMYFYVVFAAFIALRIPILIGALIWTVTHRSNYGGLAGLRCDVPDFEHGNKSTHV